MTNQVGRSPVRAGFLALACVACSVHTGTVSADQFCVLDESDLRAALTASASNGQDDVIRIHAGTFYTGGLKFSINTGEGNSLSISGGWTDFNFFSCGLQNESASATVLDGQDTTAVLEIKASAFGTLGATSISLSNVTLAHGSTSINGEAAALGVFSGDQAVEVEHTIITGHHQSTATPNIFSNAVTFSCQGEIHLINNALSDLHSNYAEIAFFAQDASQTVFINNNTLIGSGSGFPVLLDSSNGSAFHIANNAIAGPGYYSLVFNSRNSGDLIRVWLYNNLGYWSRNDGYKGIAVQAEANNNGDIDPRFVSASDFRPAPGSPLVNSGLNAPYGGASTSDLDGHARVDLGIIDVGAWESATERIFADAFE